MDPLQDHRSLSMLEYEKLKSFASREAGVTARSSHLPTWIDVERLRKGQQLLSTKLFSLDFAALGGLLLGLHDPENIVPLLITGKSRNVPSLFIRYLSTINQVRQWYLGDILDHSSPAHKSLAFVRCRHLAAYRKVNACISKCENKETSTEQSKQVWMSQSTMVRVQFAFIGLILLYPLECGITSDVETVQVELCYYWRVIGHLLGIDDRYNLCSHSFQVTLELCEKFRDELVQQINCNGITNQMPRNMAKDIIRSLNTVLLFNISGDVYLRYWCRVLQVNPEVWPQINGLWDKLSFRCLVNITQSSWSIPRTIIQKVTTGRIQYSIKNQESIHREYCRKYPSTKYSLSEYQQTQSSDCPLSYRVSPDLSVV